MSKSNVDLAKVPITRQRRTKDAVRVLRRPSKIFGERRTIEIVVAPHSRDAQVHRNNVAIELDEGARDWIADKGYDPKFGARPLARVIQENIKKPLAEELLFGELSKGGIVRVILKDRKLDFELTPSKPGGASKSKPRGKKKEPVLIES